MTGPLVLVVADRTDLGGRAVALDGPAARLAGARPLVVTPLDLARARWVHRVDARGRATTCLGLDGREPLRDGDLAAVWWRALTPLEPAGSAAADPRDHLYAVSELTALVTSWLLSLGPRVVNRPSGADPSGPAWPLHQWAAVARRHGVGRTLPGERRRLVVLGESVIGAVDGEEREAALGVAAEAGCRSLGLTLDGRGRVVGSSTAPRLAGREELRAAARLLAEVAA
ncbi:hypothetical protein [Ornithinimicrobium tianjinense]|uniref:Uncharacterized protein n=1 Tax=Ornithinimicrobium tianjinense TaxID=1195761 RepID=A0A917BTF0_9MICO|nr:hypothetical protein [Ornithinimicrobium tianjinense]GGF58251.1 hypothetical protein GCM10011366_27540 [Ornithinimicrobium tianjinense]